MKFLLISAVLAGLQPVYTDESVCKRAAEVINESYPNEGAVCIPMPAQSLDDIEQERILYPPILIWWWITDGFGGWRSLCSGC